MPGSDVHNAIFSFLRDHGVEFIALVIGAVGQKIIVADSIRYHIDIVILSDDIIISSVGCDSAGNRKHNESHQIDINDPTAFDKLLQIVTKGYSEPQ